MKLSKHFTLQEFCNTSYSNYIEDNLEYGKQNLETLSELAELLESARTLLGDVPIIINSGVRCPSLNTKVGGSATSQHCKCEAVDFTPRNMTVAEAFDILKNGLDSWGQLIDEKVGSSSWIHLSLGEPYRDAAKCNQAYIYDGKTYTKV